VLLRRGDIGFQENDVTEVEINGLKTEKNRLELHFIYAAVIFTLFTAFLMSDRWTDKPDFTTYLTNVATFV
jgi:hypothetical protein